MMVRASAFKLVVLFVLVVAVSVIGGCAGNETEVPTPAPASGNSGSSADPAPVPAPVTLDDPKSLVELKCSMCHSLDRVWSADYDRAEWTDTVDRMKRNGLVITDEEYTTIIDYLAE
jgi:cytochrome c5